jgi:hypothetical protein
VTAVDAAAASTADGAVDAVVAVMGLGLAALVVLAVVAVVTEARRAAEYTWIARERRAEWEAREEERLRSAEYVLVPWSADER